MSRTNPRNGKRAERAETLRRKAVREIKRTGGLS